MKNLPAIRRRYKITRAYLFLRSGRYYSRSI